MSDEMRSMQLAERRTRFSQKDTKKRSRTVVVDPSAPVYPATILLAMPQNKKDDQGKPTGNFTYMFSPSHESKDALLDQPSQFHGSGMTHHFEEPPAGHDYAILGLPSYVNAETQSEGLAEFTLPFVGPNGVLTGKCPTEVRTMAFMPVKIKGTEVSSFHMFDKLPSRKKKDEEGKEPKEAKESKEEDPDAPLVEGGDTASSNAANPVEDDSGKEIMKTYHMIKIGSISPYKELEGKVLFGEFLQAMVKANVVPRVWYAPESNAGAPPNKAGEARLQTWNSDVRCLIFGPQMQKMLKRVAPDEKIPVGMYADMRGSDRDRVRRKALIDMKTRRQAEVTCWEFPLEFIQDTEGLDEDEAPPDQVLHNLNAKSSDVYAKFGVDDRMSQNARLWTVTQFVRQKMNGGMVVARDWVATANLNGKDDKEDWMTAHNPVARKLDGMMNEGEAITSYAWTLLAIKGDFRRVVQEHGIEVSRVYAATHFEIIKKSKKDAGRDREKEDNAALQCQVEFGMFPISTETTNVQDYVPDKRGFVDVEDGSNIKVRYFLLNPGMLHPYSKKVAALISKYAQEDPESKWGDHFTKLLSPNKVPMSQAKGAGGKKCPKDLLEASAIFENQMYGHTMNDLMLYAVCYVEDFDSIDGDSLHCRRDALKILSHHYPFKPDFTFCSDGKAAQEAAQEKKRKRKEKSKAASEHEDEPEPEPKKVVKAEPILDDEDEDEDEEEPKPRKSKKDKKAKAKAEVVVDSDSEPEASADKGDDDEDDDMSD